MNKKCWIHLPVINVRRSTVFFTQLGFKLNEYYDERINSSSFLIGEDEVVMMLFDEETFKKYLQDEPGEINHAEILLSIDAESKEEVDEIALRAVAAGGKCDHVPTEMTGFMYGCLFTDLDGHRWNVLYMSAFKVS